ncbi:NADAR family protein [Bacillus swezeyi]
MKVTDKSIHLEFSDLPPNLAKRKGRRVKLRPDWEEVKETFMYEIVKAKFEQNDQLKNRLLQTGESTLIEGNTWGDRVWGVCNGIGENKLGKILMRVRNELKEVSHGGKQST